MFGELRATVPSLERDLQLYRENGDTAALVRALDVIFEASFDVVLASVGGEAGTSVAKVFRAVNDAFEGLGAAWQSFTRGETAEGIEALFFGLGNSSRALLPTGLGNSDAFKTVVGTLDGVVSNLTANVLEYKRRILESSVCWKARRAVAGAAAALPRALLVGRRGALPPPRKRAASGSRAAAGARWRRRAHRHGRPRSRARAEARRGPAHPCALRGGPGEERLLVL